MTNVEDPDLSGTKSQCPIAQVRPSYCPTVLLSHSPLSTVPIPYAAAIFRILVVDTPSTIGVTTT